jgi:hypothetical protein
MESAASAPAVSPQAQLYRPRAVEHTVLHQIVREHLATFLRTARAQHESGLPAFVEQEFRDFLTCGAWARGFALPE